jgi:hypothetical protein
LIKARFHANHRLGSVFGRTRCFHLGFGCSRLEFRTNVGRNKNGNGSIAQEDVIISEHNSSLSAIDSADPQQNIGDGMHSQLRECTAFDASEVEAMGQAFDAACATLQLSDGEDAFRKLVACKVIECAESGERNPQRIYDLVLSEFRRSRH